MKNLNKVSEIIDEIKKKLENLDDKTSLKKLKKELEPLKKEIFQGYCPQF